VVIACKEVYLELVSQRDVQLDVHRIRINVSGSPGRKKQFAGNQPEPGCRGRNCEGSIGSIDSAYTGNKADVFGKIFGESYLVVLDESVCVFVIEGYEI